MVQLCLLSVACRRRQQRRETVFRILRGLLFTKPLLHVVDAVGLECSARQFLRGKDVGISLRPCFRIDRSLTPGRLTAATRTPRSDIPAGIVDHRARLSSRIIFSSSVVRFRKYLPTIPYSASGASMMDASTILVKDVVAPLDPAWKPLLFTVPNTGSMRPQSLARDTPSRSNQGKRRESTW